MDWVEGVGALAGNVATGGLMGLFGSVVGVGARWLQERQRQKHQAKAWDHEVRLQELQMQARAAETEQEIRLADTAGKWRGLEATAQADAQALAGPGLPNWVRAVRALWRPVLTLLTVALVYLFWQDIPPGSELRVYVVKSIVFAASSSIMWWFGDRALAPPAAKHL